MLVLATRTPSTRTLAHAACAPSTQTLVHTGRGEPCSTRSGYPPTTHTVSPKVKSGEESKWAQEPGVKGQQSTHRRTAETPQTTGPTSGYEAYFNSGERSGCPLPVPTCPRHGAPLLPTSCWLPMLSTLTGVKADVTDSAGVWLGHSGSPTPPARGPHVLGSVTPESRLSDTSCRPLHRPEDHTNALVCRSTALRPRGSGPARPWLHRLHRDLTPGPEFP